MKKQWNKLKNSVKMILANKKTLTVGLVLGFVIGIVITW
jgi:hypothetical protein